MSRRHLNFTLVFLRRFSFILNSTSLVSRQRVRHVNEIEWKWWRFFFYRKNKTLVVIIVFRLGKTEINLYGQRFKNRATYLLKASTDIKIIFLGIFSVQRFFGENFQAPHKQRFGFWDDSALFHATMTFSRRFCNTLHVLRSEKQTCGHTNLKYPGKRQVNTRVKGICNYFVINYL